MASPRDARIAVEGMPDTRVLASLDGLTLRFPTSEACEVALGHLGRFEAECLREGAFERVDERTGRWTDLETFEQVIDEIEDLRFKVRFPKAERQAWIATLATAPYQASLYRGERPMRDAGYASDPGDMGTGRYLTTCPETARHYGPVGRHEVAYANAALVESRDIVRTVNILYRTCRGADRVGGADTMRADFLEAGVEALVIHGYDSPKGHHTIVEFTSAPPRETRAWDEAEDLEISPGFTRP